MKQLSKVIFFRSFFSSKNDSKRNSEVFSLLKMIPNRIPRFFLIRKWFLTEFQGFSHPKMFRNGIPRVFLFCEMVWNGILRVFLFRENVLNGILRVFLSRELVWNGILRVFLFRENVRNGIPRLFLFRELVRNGIPRVFLFRKLVRNGIPRVFLFRETGEIPTELLSVPSCSVFRGIILLSENGNPIRHLFYNVAIPFSFDEKGGGKG
jgi:hypothetical protein